MALTVNGVDAKSTYGFMLSEAPGWADAPQTKYPTAALPGRQGAVQLGTDDDQPRRLTLRGTVVGTTNSAARAALDKLKAQFAKPTVTVAFADDTTRQWTVVMDGFVVAPPAASLIATEFPVEITCTALDPYAYQVGANSVNINTLNTLVALQQGTAPVRPVLTLTATGSISNPTFTLTDSASNVVGTLALTLSMVNTDVLVIDCAAMTVKKNGVSVLSAISSGDFFLLDVATQGNYETSAWPKLKIQLGTGTLYTLVCSYNRAWR
jgi:phage-related protein